MTSVLTKAKVFLWDKWDVVFCNASQWTNIMVFKWSRPRTDIDVISSITEIVGEHNNWMESLLLSTTNVIDNTYFKKDAFKSKGRFKQRGYQYSCPRRTKLFSLEEEEMMMTIMNK